MSRTTSHASTAAAAAVSIAAVLSLGVVPVGAASPAPPVGGTTATLPAPAPSTSGATEATEVTGGTQFVAAVTQPAIAYLQSSWKVFVHDGAGWINEGKPYEITHGCSGFVVDPTGYVATAGHCIDQQAAIEGAVLKAVEQYSGTYTWEDGSVVTDADLLAHGLEHWTFSGLEARSDPDLTVHVALSEEAGGDVLRARVIETSPLVGGTDIALLKVEATGLPAVELATGTPEVGDEVVSIGYPSATDDVTDPQSAPSFMGGAVSSVRTRDDGLLPVYEVGAAVSPGMSGGPTVDHTGRVIGVNSYGHASSHTDVAYVQPATLLQEMMNRHGVGGPSELDATYRSALEAYFAGDHAAAIAGFDTVLDSLPDHTVAETYRGHAVEEQAQAPAPAGPAGDGVDPQGTTSGGGNSGAGDTRTGLPAPAADSGGEGWPLQLIGVILGLIGAAAYGVSTFIRRQVRRRPEVSPGTSFAPPPSAAAGFAAHPQPAGTAPGGGHAPGFATHHVMVTEPHLSSVQASTAHQSPPPPVSGTY